MIRISKALPIQFWLEGEESFNEKLVCGITPVCFCQPWEAGDDLPLPFADEPFTPTTETSEETIEIVLPDPADWTSRNISPSLVNWTTVGDTRTLNFGSVSPSDQTSEQLYVDWTFTPGKQYSITLHIHRGFSGSANSTIREASLYIMDGAYNPVFSESITPADGESDYDITIEFTATDECEKIVLQIREAQDGDGGGLFPTTQFNSSDATESTTTEEIIIPDPASYALNILNSAGDVVETIPYEPFLLEELNQYLYLLSFRFDDYDITNEQVSLEIVNDDSPSDSPSRLAYSDCISVKVSHDCTVAFDYYNNSNFSGIPYADVSPELTFRLRIPAIFYHPENPAEQEDVPRGF